MRDVSMSGIRRNRGSAFALVLAFVAVIGVVACNSVHGQVPEFGAKSAAPPAKGVQTAVLAGGCFWGVDAVFKHVKGVGSVVSGYSGGNRADAQYEIVSTGETGHAESVKITFDPLQVSYGQLLRVFFSVAHDPTELNRQGPDTGAQYRSAIFYANEEQKQIALAYIDQLDKARVFSSPIVTQVVPLKEFFAAEEYHQNYLARNPHQPYIVFNDMPKVHALQKQFPEIYKQ